MMTKTDPITWSLVRIRNPQGRGRLGIRFTDGDKSPLTYLPRWYEWIWWWWFTLCITFAGLAEYQGESK